MEVVKILPSAPQVVLQGTLKGAYAAGTDYAPGDVVTYQGGTFIMHTDAAAGTAPTDTDYWQAINSPQGYLESLDRFVLVNATTDNTISVDQNGNVGTDVSTDGAVHIENTGNTGIGLGVYSNIAGTAQASLVVIHADNAGFGQPVVNITNDSTNHGLYLFQVGALAANDHALYVVSTTQQTLSPLVKFDQQKTDSTKQVLELSQYGAGAHIRFTGDPNVTAPADGDMWYDGSALKFRNGSTTQTITWS